MIGIRGERSRGARASLACATVLLLAGCATVNPQAGSTPSMTPTPTAACPQVEGVELPPECAPYDPEQSMAQNDAYRQRMDITDEARAASEETIENVRPALDALRASGELSTDAVVAVMADAGLTSAQTIGDARGVAFGVDGPEGGCIFGEVSPDALIIEAGGYIMDGGCLPAQ
ncbi:MAG TPA: hypothetical protein VFF85_15035 [Microbacterium sp.]|jgi:hypothetical protein|nr:hypothetical protein [Microbacterium sp.]